MYHKLHVLTVLQDIFTSYLSTTEQNLLFSYLNIFRIETAEVSVDSVVYSIHNYQSVLT